MAWDDWVFGLATGGAYNAGKAIFKASEAFDQAGEAAETVAEGAGTALAALSSTITKLGKDISSFIKETEELITYKRLTPRNEADLWDEELERLTALRQREAELLSELEALEAGDDDRSWFDCLWESLFGGMSYEELIIRTKLAVIRSAIYEILYEEPGVIPTSIHNIQLILERFNNLEQPRIEELFDSLNNNLEESRDILQEVNKLFVIKTWKAVPISELTEKQLRELEEREAALEKVDQLIEKNSVISAQLQQAVVNVYPTSFGIEKMLSPVIKGNGGGKRDFPAGKDEGPSGLSDSFTDNDTWGDDYPHLIRVQANGPSFALKGKVSINGTQPMGVSLATMLNHNMVAGYLENYHIIEGRLHYYKLEKLKIEKAIFRIKWIPIEEPGVIPKILEEIRQVIARFQTEGQPRLESVMDNINATIVETTAVLSNVKKSLERVQGALDFLARNIIYIKIGLGVAGGLTLLILVMSLIVMFRLAFTI